MAWDPEKTLRRIFSFFYLFVTFGACIWVTISIVSALLRDRPIKLRKPPIDVTNRAQVLGCERDVAALVQDLHRQAFAVQMAALEKETDLQGQWDVFLDRWRDRWTEVGKRCRLQELAGTGTPAIDRLADAHAQVDELATAYGALLDSFNNRYVDRLRSIRQALAEARAAANRIHSPHRP